MEDIVIVGAARSAIGKFGGTLAKTPAADLGAHVLKKLLERSGVQPAQVSEVILGQVLAAGVGQNPARQAAIKAGLPDHSKNRLSVSAFGRICHLSRFWSLSRGVSARCGGCKANKPRAQKHAKRTNGFVHREIRLQCCVESSKFLYQGVAYKKKVRRVAHLTFPDCKDRTLLRFLSAFQSAA
jgi:hypothetical protein